MLKESISSCLLWEQKLKLLSKASLIFIWKIQFSNYCSKAKKVLKYLGWLKLEVLFTIPCVLAAVVCLSIIKNLKSIKNISDPDSLCISHCYVTFFCLYYFTSLFQEFIISKLFLSITIHTLFLSFLKAMHCKMHHNMFWVFSIYTSFISYF